MDNVNTGFVEGNVQPPTPENTRMQTQGGKIDDTREKHVTPMDVDVCSLDEQSNAHTEREMIGSKTDDKIVNMEDIKLIEIREEEWKKKVEEKENIIEERNKELEKERKGQEEMKTVLGQVLNKNTELDNKVKQMTEDLNRARREAAELSQQNKQQEAQHEENSRESRMLQQAILERNEFILKLQQDLKSEKAKKDAALTRFSELAGARISEGNSAIADLGDVHRPQKLAEILSEIYDNEWTDAFEIMTMSNSTQEAIDKLLKILQGAFSFCTEIAEDERKRINEALQNVFSQSKREPFPGTVTKKLKDFIKSVAQDYLPVVIERFYKDTAYTREEDFQKYIRKCLQFSWFACCQDPPLDLVFDINENDDYDSKSQSQYTRTGAYIDFLVWPVLCVEKNGALLSKGVVQCKTEKNESRIPVQGSGDKSTSQETVNLANSATSKTDGKSEVSNPKQGNEDEPDKQETGKITDSTNSKENEKSEIKDIEQGNRDKQANQETGKIIDSDKSKEDAKEASSKEQKTRKQISRIMVGPAERADGGQDLNLDGKTIQKQRNSLAKVPPKDNKNRDPIYNSQQN